jgi:hypothetical protein
MALVYMVLAVQHGILTYVVSRMHLRMPFHDKSECRIECMCLIGITVTYAIAAAVHLVAH